MAKRRLFVLAAIGLAGILVLALVWSRSQDSQVQASVIGAPVDPRGFATADGPRPLDFPADYGPHPDYQTEWWYYTGNLDGAGGRHFGYQLTIFRRALVPPADLPARSSDWATDQVYMGHFALTDVAGGRHRAFERFSRGAAGLAGARAEPYRVWLDDWQVMQVDGQGPDVTRLQAAQDGVALDLVLTDLKGPVPQGDGGYSQKGPEPGNASYYYSLTRLASDGSVQIGDQRFQVSGLSWMDHEYSTSALAEDQAGWDWFALQFDDGTEIMVAQLRNREGGISFADGTFVAGDGSARRLPQGSFQIDVTGTWRSPHSEAVYPSRWTIRVPDLDLTLDVEPYLADQEMNVSSTYWEGAVRATGRRAGRAIGGNGYVEMTGYAGFMAQRF
jgi:predicted secreted hydrolase